MRVHPTCCLDSCDRNSYRRRLCVSHYRAFLASNVLPSAAQRDLSPFPVSPVEAAYLAGLFDGEGTIVIIRMAGVRPHHADRWEFRISVGMTDQAGLLAFQAAFGGTVRPHREAKGAARALYAWSPGQWLSYRVLLALRPFLRVKAPQADVAVRYIAARSHRSNGSPTPTAEEVAIFEALRQELQTLNHSHWQHARQ